MTTSALQHTHQFSRYLLRKNILTVQSEKGGQSEDENESPQNKNFIKRKDKNKKREAAEMTLGQKSGLMKKTKATRILPRGF